MIISQCLTMFHGQTLISQISLTMFHGQVMVMLWPTLKIFPSHIPGAESMGNPWKNRGKFMGQNPWISLKSMEDGARAKFHGFHEDISMLSMLAWDRNIVRIFPVKAWEAWSIKPWGFTEAKAWEAWYFLVYLIISSKHGKAWPKFMQMNLHPSGSLVAADFPGLF